MGEVVCGAAARRSGCAPEAQTRLAAVELGFSGGFAASPTPPLRGTSPIEGEEEVFWLVSPERASCEHERQRRRSGQARVRAQRKQRKMVPLVRLELTLLAETDFESNSVMIFARYLFD